MARAAKHIFKSCLWLAFLAAAAPAALAQAAPAPSAPTAPEEADGGDKAPDLDEDEGGGQAMPPEEPGGQPQSGDAPDEPEEPTATAGPVIDGKVDGLGKEPYRILKQVKEFGGGKPTAAGIRSLRKALLEDRALDPAEEDLVAELLSSRLVWVTPTATAGHPPGTKLLIAAPQSEEARGLLALTVVPDRALAAIYQARGPVQGLSSLVERYRKGGDEARNVRVLLRAELGAAWAASDQRADDYHGLREAIGSLHKRAGELPRRMRPDADRMIADAVAETNLVLGGKIPEWTYDWLRKDPDAGDRLLDAAKGGRERFLRLADVKPFLDVNPGLEGRWARLHERTLDLLRASREPDARRAREIAQVVSETADVASGLREKERAGLLALAPPHVLPLRDAAGARAMARAEDAAAGLLALLGALDGDAETFAALARAWLRQGSPRDAERCVEIALGLRPGLAAAREVQERLARQPWNVLGIPYGRFSEADLAAAKHPADAVVPPARKTLGAKVAEALKAPLAATRTATLRSLRAEFTPLFALAHDGRGEEAWRLRVQEGAGSDSATDPLRAYRALVELRDEDPTSIPVLLELARVCVQVRRYGEALAHLDAAAVFGGPGDDEDVAHWRRQAEAAMHAASRLPAGASPELALAVATLRRAIELGDAQAARREIDAALALHPKCAAALVARAKLQADPKAALADVNAAVAADATCAEAKGCRAQLLQGAGDVKGAEAEAQAALALDPACLEAHMVRVQAALAKGDAAAAGAALDVVLGHHPGSAELRFLKGRLGMQRGDGAAAKADLARAAALDPTNVNLQLGAADALAGLGDVEAARLCLQRASSLGERRATQALMKPPFKAAGK